MKRGLRRRRRRLTGDHNNMGTKVRLRLVIVAVLFVFFAGASVKADVASGLRGSGDQAYHQSSHNPFSFLVNCLNSIILWFQGLSRGNHRVGDTDSLVGGYPIDNSTDVLTNSSLPTTTLFNKTSDLGTESSLPDIGVPLQPADLKEGGKIATIVGGNNAGPREAPFFVMMLFFNDAKGRWEFNGCGGTLASNRHILTAGHCTVGYGDVRSVRSKHAVYVGAYQPFWGNPGVRFHFSRIKAYTIHHNFDDGPNDSDVAIVTMDVPVDLDLFQPIGLAPPSLLVENGDMVSVYGFGRQSFYDEEQVMTLQKVRLPFIDQETCEDYYGSRVLDDMVCAGRDKGGQDACRGDSGGPMVVSGAGGQVFQVGVVSWGDGCAEAGKPGVYASVQYHFDWIRETICNTEQTQTGNNLCSEQYDAAGIDDSFVPSDMPSIQPSMTPSTSHPSPFPSLSPVQSSLCTKKKLGEECSYGGECCSGACVAESSGGSGSSYRVCSSTSDTPTAETTTTDKNDAANKKSQVWSPTSSPSLPPSVFRKGRKKGGKFG